MLTIFARIAPAKNPFPRMELHRDDLLAEAGIPLLAKILDFGQFRHRGKIERAALRARQ